MRMGICLRFIVSFPTEHDIPLKRWAFAWLTVECQPPGSKSSRGQRTNYTQGGRRGFRLKPRAASWELCFRKQAPFWRAHHSRTCDIYNYTPALQSNRGDVQTHGRRLALIVLHDFDNVSVTHILFRGDQPIGYRCSVGALAQHTTGELPRP